MLPKTLLGLAFCAVSVLALPTHRQIPDALETIDSSTSKGTANALDAISGSVSKAASDVLDKDVKFTASVFENGIADGVTNGLAGAMDSVPGPSRRRNRGIQRPGVVASFDPKGIAPGVEPRAVPSPGTVLSGRQSSPLESAVLGTSKSALDTVSGSVSGAASDVLGKEVKITPSVLENGIAEGMWKGSQGAAESLPVPGRTDAVPGGDPTA